MAQSAPANKIAQLVFGNKGKYLTAFTSQYIIHKMVYSFLPVCPSIFFKVLDQALVSHSLLDLLQSKAFIHNHCLFTVSRKVKQTAEENLCSNTEDTFFIPSTYSGQH